MKYIKKYERIQREDYVVLTELAKPTRYKDFNFDDVFIVTKIDFDGGFSDYPYYISDFDFQKGTWVKSEEIREATSEEFENFKIKRKANKYNL